MLIKSKTLLWNSFKYSTGLHKIQLNPVNSVPRVQSFHCLSCLQALRRPANTPAVKVVKKYEIMNESNAPIIENTDEERPFDRSMILTDVYDDINLKRGENGVFEIEDLVALLKRENAKDIFVATVPKEIHYVDYICVSSGRSKRHLIALAEFVKKVYKMKCNQTDLIPKIEGKKSDEWLALDLGNIALHIFAEKARKLYDLESLWAVGVEFDELSNKKDGEIVDMLQSYSNLLKDLKPN